MNGTVEEAQSQPAQTTCGLRPLAARIVVEVLEEEKKTPGGILLPESMKEKPQRGKVLAVGPGRQIDDGTWLGLEVKEGDQIYFTKYAGHDVKVDGRDLLVMASADVLAVIESTAQP